MVSNGERAVLARASDAGVVTLTLDRPEKRNAIDATLLTALADALEHAAIDADVRAVVLTGAGGAFCAGGDIGGFDQLRDGRTYRHASHRLSDLIESVERLEKPVVAAVGGVAMGAGLALALACDWRIGSPRTRILLREGQIGLIPTHGGLTRLVKHHGLARAKEILLGGDDLDADAARSAGLLSELCARDEDLLPAAHDRAHRMLARAPLSFGAAKRLLHLAADVDQRSAMVAESLAQTHLLQSADHQEGLAAAREHRAPVFTGA
ncbi:2,3-dehydroadipyl-CoA hydratase [Paraconexibacter sp. AEG42_29]|uniref:2,3-dehydroadipyl-CoA hydratase n=1 Tax=Paraconexibacter sp. AEG42_29 TaxID=2997339 RepID=A0AAU7B0G3_9ACTN